MTVTGGIGRPFSSSVDGGASIGNVIVVDTPGPSIFTVVELSSSSDTRGVVVAEGTEVGCGAVVDIGTSTSTGPGSAG